MSSLLSKKAKEVMAAARDDETTKVILEDPVIRRFLEWQCRRYFRSGKHTYLRQKVRHLASFLMFVRETSNMRTMYDLLKPENFDEVYNLLEEFAGTVQVSEDKYEMKEPSKTKTAGEMIAECCQREINNCQGSGDAVRQEALKNWMGQYDGNFFVLSREARDTLLNRRLNKVPMLPFLSELEQLHKYLDESLEAWKYDGTNKSYVDLVRLLEAKILTFNRKRPGELSKITVAQYERSLELNKTAPNPDLCANMDATGRELMKHMDRIEFIGKHHQRAAVLMTPLVSKRMKKLHKIRPNHVPSNSPFLFARVKKGAKTPIYAGTCLNEVVKQAKLKRPALFKATGLRKHLATMSHSLHFSLNLTEHLATFMGHHYHIHRSVYTLPQDAIQRSKIAHCLIKINGGKVDKVVGKTAADFPEDLELEAESETESSSTAQNLTESDFEPVDEADASAGTSILLSI